MSFYHISFDAFLGLAYAAVCAFLALVLVSPVPFKTQIRQYMALAVYYLMYAIAIPMWLFFTSLNTLNRLGSVSFDDFKQHRRSMMQKHKGKTVKAQRNFIIGCAGIVSFVLLYRIFKVLGGAPESALDEKSSSASSPPAVRSKKD